jgi:hypothetical protein
VVLTIPERRQDGTISAKFVILSKCATGMTECPADLKIAGYQQLC